MRDEPRRGAGNVAPSAPLGNSGSPAVWALVVASMGALLWSQLGRRSAPTEHTDGSPAEVPSTARTPTGPTSGSEDSWAPQRMAELVVPPVGSREWDSADTAPPALDSTFYCGVDGVVDGTRVWVGLGSWRREGAVEQGGVALGMGLPLGRGSFLLVEVEGYTPQYVVVVDGVCAVGDLPRADGMIEGIVVDSDGGPVEGAKVSCDMVVATSGPDGRFSMYPHASGCELMASRDGRRSSPVFVPPGGGLSARVRLAPDPG